MNKRQLYESIMKNVAKEVKKALNESVDTEINDMIQKIEYFKKGTEMRMHFYPDPIDPNDIEYLLDLFNSGVHDFEDPACDYFTDEQIKLYQVIIYIKCIENIGYDIHNINLQSWMNPPKYEFSDDPFAIIIKKLESRYNRTGKPFYTFRGLNITKKNEDIIPTYVVEYNGLEFIVFDWIKYDQFIPNDRDWLSPGNHYTDQSEIRAVLIK